MSSIDSVIFLRPGPVGPFGPGPVPFLMQECSNSYTHKGFKSFIDNDSEMQLLIFTCKAFEMSYLPAQTGRVASSSSMVGKRCLRLSRRW